MTQEISVVIPTRNRAHLVVEAVRSALHDERHVAEVLVVDDCSTDATEQVLEDISDPRFRFLRLERHSGACAARNLGIQHCTAGSVAFLDADDLWKSSAAAAHCRNLGRAELSLLGMEIRFSELRRTRFGSCDLGNNPVASVLRGRHGTFSSSCIAVSRRLVDRGLRFDTTFPALQDLDFVLAALAEYAAWPSADPVARVVKRQLGDGNVYSGRRPLDARLRFIEKWHPLLNEDPIALRSQYRKLVLDALAFGGGDDVRLAIGMLRLQSPKPYGVREFLLRQIAVGQRGRSRLELSVLRRLF